MDRLLTVLLISINSGFCFCSWTEDGGYIGLYPGGCAVQSDCPSDERCMHSVEETICPQNHENLCRCTLGCEVDNHIIRYEQWKPVPGKGFCKCLNSATNNSYCSKNMDLWWEMLVHVPLLFIEEDKEEIEISLMKFWLVINSPSWRINKILFLFSTSTITLYKILKMFILQEWHQHDVNKKLWHINECTVYRFTKKKWSHL